MQHPAPPPPPVPANAGTEAAVAGPAAAGEDRRPDAPLGPSDAPPPRAASLPQVVAAVFWSFLGIRRNAALRRDAVSIRPHQVIIIGVVMAALLVVGLLLLVRTILRS
jgi:hypothetical protein